jgi:hypothetical protein
MAKKGETGAGYDDGAFSANCSFSSFGFVSDFGILDFGFFRRAAGHTTQNLTQLP